MTNKTKITVTLTLNTAAPDAKEIGNAVRRATEALTKTGAVFVPSVPVIAKGVTIKTREVKGVTQPHSPVREWAQENGYPEVAGKRGRLSKTVIAAYEAANG
jgi:L-lysine 2,3-aminomutase